MDEDSHWNDADFTDFTLIIPSVAVGNVGQLACDLLITSLNMRKIASLYSPAFIPVLGHNPYNLQSSSLSGSCELYVSEVKKLVVLQLRSPLVFKYAKKFLEGIVEKFKMKSIREIIILSSSYAHEKKYIQTSSFRYKATDSSHLKKVIRDLNWLEHESEGYDCTKIYGGGFASILFEICLEKGVPALLLYKYCSEGDNIPDAYDMVQHLTSLLPLFDSNKDFRQQIVQPVSWNLMFGRPPPIDIY